MTVDLRDPSLCLRDAALLRQQRVRNDRRHLFWGKAAIADPDGSISWEDEWMPNLLADEGEADVIADWLKGGTITSKYLALLNAGSQAETTTMATMTETTTPGTNGYNRVQITTGDWGTTTLNGGDNQSTAAQKTFGPASGANWTATGIALVTASTGTGGLFLAVLALSGTTTINIGQSFLYTLTYKQQ